MAVGAAYAKYTYANRGIRKIAIIDFDVHHGNGTEQVVRNVGPRSIRCRFSGEYPDMPHSLVCLFLKKYIYLLVPIMVWMA